VLCLSISRFATVHFPDRLTVQQTDTHTHRPTDRIGDRSVPIMLTLCCNDTHTHNHFTALWILSGTTRVSRYQKKHSPTHTYCGHQSSLICLLHLLRSMASSLLENGTVVECNFFCYAVSRFVLCHCVIFLCLYGKESLVIQSYPYEWNVHMLQCGVGNVLIIVACALCSGSVECGERGWNSTAGPCSKHWQDWWSRELGTGALWRHWKVCTVVLCVTVNCIPSCGFHGYMNYILLCPLLSFMQCKINTPKSEYIFMS